MFEPRRSNPFNLNFLLMDYVAFMHQLGIIESYNSFVNFH